jgi:hypothetical protein
MRLSSLALTTVLSISAGAALLAPSTGCMMMQGLAPETRLQDHVYLLNDEARWGRVDLAAGRCSTEYRVAFVRSHRRWGRGISIGDVEISNIAMLQGGAQSLVTYSWIDDSTMELHATTVRQSWIGEGDGFRLAGEDIVSGDDGLYLDVEGGPQRLPDAENPELLGEAGEGIATAEEIDREITGQGEPAEPGAGRERTPGERALASVRPSRFDSQGRRIDE